MNKELFKTTGKPGKIVPPATVVNNAGGAAYNLGPKHSLVQAAVTGCLTNTFYTDAKSQLDKVVQYAKQVDPAFLARTAIYGWEQGWMKDVPAVLTAVLATLDRPDLLGKVLPRVIVSPKMVRNFMTAIRSGSVGRKSFPNVARRFIREWLRGLKGKQMLNATVGGDLPFRDIIRMVHAKPANETERAYWGWAVGIEPGGLPARTTAKGIKLEACPTWNAEALPEIVKQFEAWKKDPTGEIPDCDFRLITSQKLTPGAWMALAENVSYQTLRQGLNMFAKHDVLKDPAMVKKIANRLRDAKEISRAKLFPYQLLTAARYVDDEIPQEIRAALEDAMEIATQNVPVYEGTVAVFPDVSGSMSSPVTGQRGSGTTKMRCIDIAALVAACVMRKNPDAMIIPFEGQVVEFTRQGKKAQLNPRDTVMTNANLLAGVGGGSTNCAAPLEYLLTRKKVHPDLMIYVSDNESWINTSGYRGRGATEVMDRFRQIQEKNPKSKMVCIDITPNNTSQAPNEEKSILNVGGFNDSVFTVIKAFLEDRMNGDALVKTVEAIEL